MKPSEDLFQLIKSLTKSEKRYFKRFCIQYSTGKKNNYLKLFDFIDKQKVYDESKIKEKFKHERFIKQLSVVKDYLSKLILKSLITMTNSSNLFYELRQSVAECELLIMRGLFNQSYKKSRAIKKLCYKYGYYLLILELLGNEKVLIRELNVNNSEVELIKIVNEEELVLNELINIRKILNLNRELMSLLNTIGLPIRSEKNISKVQSIDKRLNKIFISEASSYQSKTIYFHTKIHINLVMYEYQSALKNSFILYETLKKYKYLSSKDPRNMYGAMHNLVLIHIYNKKYNKAIKYFFELGNFIESEMKKLTVQNRNNLKLNYFVLQLTLNNRMCKIEDNLYIIEESKELISQYCSHISFPETIEMIYEIILAKMISNDWKAALNYINLLLNGKIDKIRIDFKMILNIYNIIIHYELGNTDYLESFIPSCSKKINLKGKENKMEFLIIFYLKKLVYAKNISDSKLILTKLKQELQLQSISLYEKNFINKYFIVEWIDSKIENNCLRNVILRNMIFE